MLYVFVFLFAALFMLNASVTRTILSPSALFCGVWLVSLFGLLISGSDFYPVSLETLMVFLAGAIALSIGGGFGLLVAKTFQWSRETEMDQQCRRAANGVLDFSLIIVLVGLPLYVQEMMNLVRNAELLTLVYHIRGETVEAGRKGFSVISNIAVLANLLAIAAWFERHGRAWNSWRAYVCIAAALAYGWLAGSKGAAVVLLLTLFFVSSMKARRVSPAAVLSILSLMVIVFGAGLLVVNFVSQTFESAGHGFIALVKGIQQYWLGGIVAFDRIVSDPQAIESTHRIDRVFLEIANSLGANYHVPSIHADYTNVSQFSETNVYTIYFSYYKDFGWIGTVILMVLLGFVLTLVFKRAQLGHPVAILLYGMTAAGVVLSFYAEFFWLGMNGYIKALLFFGLLYSVPRLRVASASKNVLA